jgi:galactokinase
MALANICSRVTRHSQPALDHLAYPLTSLFGQSWQALEIDFQTQSIEPVPLSPDHVLIVAIPRLPLPATAPSRSEFERLGQSIAQTIGVKSLRSLDGKTLTSQEKKLSAHESAYAIHVTRENQRVIHAAQALRQGDFPQFGQYLLQSHESARDRLGLSRPELDRLVEVAQSHKACLGSRFLGSHQGSATVHVVERRRKEEFIQHLQKRYPVEPGDFVKPLALECTPDLPA